MKTILLKKEQILFFIILIFCTSQDINAQNGSNDNASSMQSFQLEFSSVDGPEVVRELQLTFSDHTSDSFDDGYDTKNLNLMQDDLNLTLNGEFYTSQAYSSITEDKIVDLVFQASGSYEYSIELRDMVDMGDQNIELRDNLLGTSFDLRSEGAYIFSADEGYYPNRFQLTFKTTTLSTTDLEIDNIDVRYINNTNTISISNPKNLGVKNVEMYNMSGQLVYKNNMSHQESLIKYQVRNINTGVYIITMATDNNKFVTKKIMAN